MSSECLTDARELERHEQRPSLGRQDEADLIGLTCWHQLEMMRKFLKELRRGRALCKQFFVMQYLGNSRSPEPITISFGLGVMHANSIASTPNDISVVFLGRGRLTNGRTAQIRSVSANTFKFSAIPYARRIDIEPSVRSSVHQPFPWVK